MENSDIYILVQIKEAEGIWEDKETSIICYGEVAELETLKKEMLEKGNSLFPSSVGNCRLEIESVKSVDVFL